VLLPKADAPIAVERDYIPLIAQSPAKMEGVIEVRVSRKMLDHLQKYWPSRKCFMTRNHF
jgi:hypothetical protein